MAKFSGLKEQVPTAPPPEEDLENPRQESASTTMMNSANTATTTATIKQVNFTPLQLEQVKEGTAVHAKKQKQQQKQQQGPDDNNGIVDDDRSKSSDTVETLRSLTRMAGASTKRVTFFILVLGLAVSGAFLGLGISSALRAQEEAFDRNAVDLVNKISTSWSDYVNAAAILHGRCRGRTFSRQDFREVYEYLTGGGLQFQAAQFDPNITHQDRAYYEQEAREFYAQYYPHIDYRGIIGFNYDNSTTLDPRNNASYYFPIHYMEPVVGNERAIDLDYHASGSRKRTVLYCMDHGKPALTDRLFLVQETVESAYGVVLMHPGYNLTSSSSSSNNNETTVWPKDLASIVIRIPDLLRRATDNQQHPSLVYVFDKSDSSGIPLFLGGVKITTDGDDTEEGEDSSTTLEFVQEKELEEVQGSSHIYQEYDIEVANKLWTVSVLALDGTFKPDIVFVIVGGVFFFVATMGLAYWVHQNTHRVAKINRLKAEAEAEKAALIIESARKAAEAERELNDFIAHEVRNPVAAAMSACSFVKTAINKKEPFKDPESLATTRDDVFIIDNALMFVNDLLRNMLDMHRATNNQLRVTLCATDVLHDVLEPVRAMLTQRGGKVDVQISCDQATFAMADRLRLKQVMLNLGRNSAKFVDEGFIRLTAKKVDGGIVELAVEDSGPGVPNEKKKMLFQKYQESLDMLSQGTGIGLFLCKNLVDLMNGHIYLDDNFDCGLPGCPGTRFVVELQVPTEDCMPSELEHLIHGDGASKSLESTEYPSELPANLNLLFCDDDPILRKLFSRTVRTVAPGWNIREASNGETALQLVETVKFDLIFMDMYMASVQKQLLGTETVNELRNRGVTCRICGLSANDKEAEFLEAGADVFTFKPFPCEKRALRQELIRVLYSQAGDLDTERGA
ncbi:respiration control sensor protein ArcB [Seminavis robusta]|uniref:histidine kinase n=1 Tax=Seminavis robusta TaxID=568900 RepID=A0A9N8E5Z1_9STRA|nr:respiration control sensor protein ArcB [Seminavis robusta]|eukprot:Sro688_g187440.1 respiration control sensor protein ArcB (906) ;mRNA; f:41601-45001